MNDSNIACFLSCTRTKSFTDTAKNLNMTHQAVSRNIQKLEEEVGYKLFVRTGQSFRLTKAGEFFLSWLTDTDRRLEWAGNHFCNDPKPKVTRLRLAFTTWLGVPDRAKQTADELINNGCEVDWQTGSDAFITQQVLEERADVAIVSNLDDRKNKPDVFYSPVPEPVVLQLLYHVDCLKEDGTPDYSAILARPLLVTDCGEALNRQIDRLYRSICARHKCQPLPIELVSNFASTISETIYGNTITFLSRNAVSCGSPSALLRAELLASYPDARVYMTCMYRLNQADGSVLHYVGRSCNL